MRYSRSPQLSDPLQRPCRVSSPSLRNELAVRLSMRITGISVPLRPLVFSLGSSRSARSVRLLDRPLEVPRADCVPADHREHRLAQREVAVEERPNARVLDLVRVRSGVSLDFSSHYQDRTLCVVLSLARALTGRDAALSGAWRRLKMQRRWWGPRLRRDNLRKARGPLNASDDR